MFNKILVISDNIELCFQFYNIFKNKKYEVELFEFGISPTSDISKFEGYLNSDIKVYNLKEKEDVKQIIDTFDLVFSIHCKQLFPPELVDSLKCINVHPGFNPINRGWYPQVFSIINNLPVGATIHEIDSKLDNGRIIAREFVKKNPYDTSLTLYNRIIQKELELINKNIDSIMHNEFQTFEPEDNGNLFLKSDFNNLLEINLDEKMTVRECIDKLRALTHGDFKNAFFIDKKTKQKIYISINLDLDEE